MLPLLLHELNGCGEVTVATDDHSHMICVRDCELDHVNGELDIYALLLVGPLRECPTEAAL